MTMMPSQEELQAATLTMGPLTAHSGATPIARDCGSREMVRRLGFQTLSPMRLKRYAIPDWTCLSFVGRRL
jgi:hypothetical protein